MESASRSTRGSGTPSARTKGGGDGLDELPIVAIGLATPRAAVVNAKSTVAVDPLTTSPGRDMQLDPFKRPLEAP